MSAFAPDGRFHGRCGWCSGIADPASGVYLERLYPGQSFCRGCGRRTLFCTCSRHVSLRVKKAA